MTSNPFWNRTFPMISIRPMAPADVPAICALARTIWQATYPGLISQAQIDYMLADRYAPDRLYAQLDDPAHAWRIAGRAGEKLGFAHASCDAGACKLDKLYVHPHRQRRGVGGALLADIKIFARNHAATRLWLQVNRGNAAALAAYRQYGFAIKAACVFEIGDGFIMDDYVMDMPL